MSVGTGRQNIIILLEITVTFLGIHKWEPDIYIGFSPVLHLQCTLFKDKLCLKPLVRCYFFTSNKGEVSKSCSLKEPKFSPHLMLNKSAEGLIVLHGHFPQLSSR
jgi:hypothetical protein